MKYLTFSSPEQTQYEIAILVPRLQDKEIREAYINPFLAGFENQIIAYDLFRSGKKTPVKVLKEYLEDLLPTLTDLGVKYLVVTDGDYYKTLTKSSSVESALGYVTDSIVGNFKVIYCPNYSRMFYDPEKIQTQIRQSMSALVDHRNDDYTNPGDSIIHYEQYPSTPEAISAWLDKLLELNLPLTADIEGFSLKHYDSGIGSITFCWGKNEGIAFPIDIREAYGPLEPNQKLERFYNVEVRGLLKNFFEKFKNKIIWHNITFDVYILVYQLFMEDLLDTEGLLYGMSVLLRNWDCTKLITYLATNSCAGNKLGLKAQAHEFSGNYAVEDIKDIRKIPISKLLRYNLVDGLSTWFVYEKHFDTMVEDEQTSIYNDIFKKSVLEIIQMQLTGLPVDMDQVFKVSTQLNQEDRAVRSKMASSQVVIGFTPWLRAKWRDKMHKQWKQKRIELVDVPVNKDTTFNPNSPNQLQVLLYDEDFMGFPVLDLTDTKQPSTGGDTLEKLKNHTTNPDYLLFLDYLIEHKTLAIILSTFIPALMNASLAPDGWHYMFGNFNLGGTLSARLSSNNPNLQNIPASGDTKAKQRLAKMIKSCIKAPRGWLFMGLDFSSLEDRISALTTKDPMKLKVYTDGFDGHCLRAFAYFGEQMPDIIGNSVKSINSIAKLYKSLRQMSKAPTFALTYQGTYITLMANCGFTEELAKQIEARYHELYEVSDKWVAAKLEQASKDGYITAAFGLRVRTPLLKQTILGTRSTPFEAAAEGRTAGNALGQSWGLLNNRAASEFMAKVRNSKFRLMIRPCAHIHDAQYYLVRDDIECVHWMNTHLVKAVQWQAHPEIEHPDVKLGGELSLFYPDWSSEIEIPNDLNQLAIAQTVQKKVEELLAA